MVALAYNDCIAARFNGSNTLLTINVIPAQVFFCKTVVPINVLCARKPSGKLHKFAPGCLCVANVPILQKLIAVYLWLVAVNYGG